MSEGINAVLGDPGLRLALRWMLAALFAAALVHKLSAPLAFERSLRDYRLLPELLLRPVVWLLIAAELGTTVMLLLGRASGSVLALLLLLLYTLAIACNLARGRRDIDCACAGPYLSQTLSPGLLFRNAGFIGIAVLSLPLGVAARDPGLLDWLTAVLAALAFALLYNAAARLAAIKGRYGRH